MLLLLLILLETNTFLYIYILLTTTDTTVLTGGTDVDDLSVEIEFWQTVKDSGDRDLLQAYLDEYPNGKFAPLARLKIKKLKSD